MKTFTKLTLLALMGMAWNMKFETWNCSAQTFTAGFDHSLAICNDGTVMSWGNSNMGQLGRGGSGLTPGQVTGLTGITAVATGYQTSSALKNDGTVWTWGRYSSPFSGTPVQVPAGTVTVCGTYLCNITAIAEGQDYFLALKNDGTVWAWGGNAQGQLGDGTTTFRSAPVQVSGLTGITAIVSGDNFCFALKNDGTVWAWGCNNNGQLGDGTSTQRTTPVQVNGITGITSVAGGSDHTIALKNDGTVWAWGGNNKGQLGDNTTTQRLTPVQVHGPGNVGFLIGITTLGAGSFSYSLALKNDGTVWSWGYNANGQLGDGTTTDRWTPVQVNGLTGIIALTGGRRIHSLALKNDGTIWAWGHNAYGQLGNGTTDVSGCQCKTAPVQSKPLCTVMSNVPTVTVTSTNLLCNGQCIGTATAATTGGSAPYTYSWNSTPVQTTITATGLCAGTYSILVTDANNKVSTNTTTITEPAALTATVASTAAACTNNNGTASITPNGGTIPYTYNWNNGQTDATATGLAIGNYTATITDTKGCPQTQTVSVTQTLAPTASVSANPNTIVIGDSLKLTAAGGATYLWSPSAGLSCSTCSNPTATPAQTTAYCVTVTDTISGCTDRACISINVDIPCGTLFIPNAFSPNNDLENDMHCVLGGCIETFHITIYNRWGEKVFESTDQKQCWDGVYQGKLLNTAVFVYDLEATLTSGEKINKKGNISLLR